MAKFILPTVNPNSHVISENFNNRLINKLRATFQIWHADNEAEIVNEEVDDHQGNARAETENAAAP